MLIRFVVSNFLSFKDEREFNMLAAPLKNLKHHVYNVDKVKVLKAAAIYGANGAGKSNLVKAFEFLHTTVSNGYVVGNIDRKKFRLCNENRSIPISFEIELSTMNKLFSYGVSLENHLVKEEWLYESGIDKDDTLIFHRKSDKDGKTNIEFAPRLRKTKEKRIVLKFLEEKVLKPSELVLSKTDEFGIDEISHVKKFIEKKIIIIHPHSKFVGLVNNFIRYSGFKKFANDVLTTFDTGVSELDVTKVDIDDYFSPEEKDLKNEIIDNFNKAHENAGTIADTNRGLIMVTYEDDKFLVNKVVTRHSVPDCNDVSFDLKEESDGTQRLLDFVIAIDGILKHDMTFIIDEIDQSLHPSLLQTLVDKIMTDDTTKGQLVFTTHESNLLNLSTFRQDEIWFAEKDPKSQSTELYSLIEYKPRYDLDIRKGYLKGRFGAIPFLAKLEDLNWNK